MILDLFKATVAFAEFDISQQSEPPGLVRLSGVSDATAVSTDVPPRWSACQIQRSQPAPHWLPDLK